MIHDDFDFTFDSSDFPVSIEEFAAYLDGNLTDDEMLRISTVIEHDETMLDVIDSMEQSELTLADYEQENMKLPEDIAHGKFDVTEIDNHCAGGGFFPPFAAVATYISSQPTLNQILMLNKDDFSEDLNNSLEETDNSSDNGNDNSSDTNKDNPTND